MKSSADRIPKFKIKKYAENIFLTISIIPKKSVDPQ